MGSIVVALIAVSQVNFLLFHVLVELFAVFVGLICFLVPWRMHRFQPNDFFLFLGCGYLGVSFLDLFHALSYKGMGIFAGNDPNYPTQLWLAARYLEAVVLLASPVFVRRHLDPALILALVCTVSGALLLAIATGVFPDAFVEGQGLTSYKVWSEYSIIFLLGAAGFHFFRKRHFFTRYTLHRIYVSILLTAVAEFCFTLYADVYGISNVAGHLFKLISFWIVLDTIFATSVEQPVRALDEILWGTNVGSWEWNLQTREARYNDRWAQILGYDLRDLQPVTHATLTAHCHPEDLERSDRIMQQCLSGELPHYHCEARMRHRDGHWVWVLIRGKIVERSSGGAPIRMSGTLSDISVVKGLEQKVLLNLARFESLIETAPVGIMTIDEDLRISLCNARAAETFDSTVQELRGARIETLIPETLRSRHAALMKGFVAGPDRTIAMSDWRLVRGLGRQGREFPMLAYLRKLTVGETRLTTFVCQDMTEIQERENRLAEILERSIEERRRAEDANAAKTAFLANASHELRTPLNAIIGFAEFLELESSQRIPAERRNEYIGLIKESGHDLLGIVNDLIDLARIESERAEISIEPVAIADLFDAVLKTFSVAMQEKSVAVDCMPGEVEHVRCDRRSTKQGLLNIFSNALKYAPPHSTIRLSVRYGSGETVIAVEDEGAGIEESVLDHVGEPFLRGQSPEVRSTSGSGLGLAVTSQMMRNQGGRLSIARRASGRGTIAALHLPDAPPDGPAAA